MELPQVATAYRLWLAAVEREENVFRSHPKNAVVTGAISDNGKYVAMHL